MLNYYDYDKMVNKEELYDESMEWIRSSNQAYQKDSFNDINYEIQAE